ncbi:Tyrosine-tRNA ligase [Coccomyxa sp. Obi]|nr:Tyrosine-tRNA ligase [Coccomyxa sp. Obi]
MILLSPYVKRLLRRVPRPTSEGMQHSDGNAPSTSASSSDGGIIQRFRDMMVSGKQLTMEEKVDLLLGISKDGLDAKELRDMLDGKANLVACDGFEPAGRMDIGQGIMKALFCNTLIRCGFTMRFWVADDCARSKNAHKMQAAARLLQEIWKAAGMQGIGEQVQFVSACEEIDRTPLEYNALWLDVARSSTLKNMGTRGDDMSAEVAHLCKQCAHAFFLKADLCLVPTGERTERVKVLAQDFCAKREALKMPVFLTHSLLPGLLQGQQQVVKGDANSGIYMDDTKQDVDRKIKKAFCPLHDQGFGVHENPVLTYITLLVLPWTGKFTVTFTKEDGRQKEYLDAAKVEADYLSGALHPSDMKPALAAALNAILQPIRDHLANDAEAKRLQQEVKAFKLK